MKNITEGKVVKLVRHRGFGFIDATDESEEDVFFHHSGLEDIYFEDLSVGDKLEFDVEQTPKGPEAKNITKVVEVNDEFDLDESEEPLDTDSFNNSDLGW